MQSRPRRRRRLVGAAHRARHHDNVLAPTRSRPAGSFSRAAGRRALRRARRSALLAILAGGSLLPRHGRRPDYRECPTTHTSSRVTCAKNGSGHSTSSAASQEESQGRRKRTAKVARRPSASHVHTRAPGWRVRRKRCAKPTWGAGAAASSASGPQALGGRPARSPPVPSHDATMWEPPTPPRLCIGKVNDAGSLWAPCNPRKNGSAKT